MVQMMTNGEMKRTLWLLSQPNQMCTLSQGIPRWNHFILGHQWHLRVLNKQMDFCYIIKETVQFYLHRRLDIEDPLDDTRTVRGGYVLIFRFVRGDGVRRDWDDIVSLHER